MRVLAFGTYQRDYPRVRQVFASLRASGVEVLEQHRPVWEGTRENWSAGPRTLARLARAEAGLVRPSLPDAEVLYVGYPGHVDMPLARRAAGNRPLVFDPLVSLYDTLVSDRGRFRSGSLAARTLGRVDRRAFGLADLVVSDTDAHGRFFVDSFGIDPARVRTCLVGADDGLFHPATRPSPQTDVLFVGKLIPLHGLETILAAAALCPTLRVRVVGDGQLAPLLASRPLNVSWTPWVEYERLPAAYHASACALGVFGTGAKAARVIPNKAYQALATATPLITGDTPAARELLVDSRDALLIPVGDPVALAAACRRLVDDSRERDRIGATGRATYEKRASRQVLGERWRALLEGLLTRR